MTTVAAELNAIEVVLHQLIEHRARVSPADALFTLRAVRMRLRDARGTVEELEIAQLRRESAGQRSLLPMLLEETGS